MRFFITDYAILYFMKVINLDKDIFEKAYALCSKEYESQEIFNILKLADDVEKQIAILKIKNICNTDEATLLVNHLTGQDGPIRESVAIKLKELLLEKTCDILDDVQFYITYVDAVCDVNPNICRFVIEFFPKLKSQDVLIELLLSKIETVFERIDNPDKEQKNFLTVRLFNLYWCLEALGTLFSVGNRLVIDYSRLEKLLQRAVSFGDYTIDEKIARILMFEKNNDVFIGLLDELKNSQNFYVRRYFCNQGC